jgi:L-alanine-DL-glutamate epimerase-like enolase superfamily enzyme
MKITSVNLRRLRLPLVVPYRLSYRTFEEFEPYYVEITTDDGRLGFGDGHISPGSSSETREGGWAFCQELSQAFVGMTVKEANRLVQQRMPESKVAASALATSLEVLNHTDLIDIPADLHIPLLTPVNATQLDDIPDELETLMAKGFKTFKVKVGKDLEADLRRVAAIQEVTVGRATLRLDANRAFDKDQGCRFASSLSPEGIELFEQPCPTEDWAANAAVARVSTVPLMLDEPICTFADIERASRLEGVRFCKLKLKRFGSMQGLKEGLDAVRAHGMEPVLGDGLGSEITSWMEACVAQSTIRNAGEFNGFLKPVHRLLNTPLIFRNGDIILTKGYRPSVDRQLLDDSTTESLTFS